MRILCVPDLHCPFHHPDAFDFLSDLKRAIKPESVICMGDEIDAHNFARWPRQADAVGPVEELDAARKALKQLAKITPRLTLVDSNHTYRPWRRAASAGLCSSFLRSRQAVLDTPDDWLWVQAAIVDGVTFIHGEGFTGPDAAINAARCHRALTVIGHVHSHAGVRYDRGATLLWGLNVGCLIDCEAPAFDYAKHHRFRPVLGAGAVLDGMPVFFPMGM